MAASLSTCSRSAGGVRTWMANIPGTRRTPPPYDTKHMSLNTLTKAYIYAKRAAHTYLVIRTGAVWWAISCNRGVFPPGSFDGYTFNFGNYIHHLGWFVLLWGAFVGLRMKVRRVVRVASVVFLGELWVGAWAGAWSAGGSLD
ncbi:hypothetical protein IQ07DRAFT_604021 [Pyrenochaeta sp. DS3sAY3a]|nr:hypothetical protein IQ07DRAFT_604021 [Pyrenochaeta sp. DS3sAY3a]